MNDPVKTTVTKPSFNSKAVFAVVKPEPIVEANSEPGKCKEVERVAPQQKVLPSILLFRAQHEKRLKKKAIELGEDPDKFMTITDDDKRNSISFRYKMKADT